MSELFKALLKAQAEMPAVKESATNPHFRSKYADLEEVIGTAGPVLHRHGIVFLQGGEDREGRPWLVTQLVHADTGQSVSFTFPIVSKDPDNPQAMGAAITYAKRYGLLAILGLATEDDDGNSATYRAAPPQAHPSGPGRDERPRTQQTPSGTVDTATGELTRSTDYAPRFPASDKQVNFIIALGKDRGFVRPGDDGRDHADEDAITRAINRELRVEMPHVRQIGKDDAKAILDRWAPPKEDRQTSPAPTPIRPTETPPADSDDTAWTEFWRYARLNGCDKPATFLDLTQTDLKTHSPQSAKQALERVVMAMPRTGSAGNDRHTN